jgi:hypothetical protein
VRNYFAIAFTLVYLTLTVGVVKTTHYCMGREKNSSLFSFSTRQCPCSLFAKEQMSCCDDEHEVLKIDDDQSGGYVLVSPIPDFNLIGEIFSQNQKDTGIIESFHFQGPADIPPPKVPRYQSLCSLVFYDHQV